MFNNLEAQAGNDFSEVEEGSIKNKLPSEIISFWEMVESNKMDIFAADGHPLGRTLMFKVDVSENPDYKAFFSSLSKDATYKDYEMNFKEITKDDALPSGEENTDASEIKEKIQEVKQEISRLKSILRQLENALPQTNQVVMVTIIKKELTHRSASYRYDS
jgi:hypothetical protein